MCLFTYFMCLFTYFMCLFAYLMCLFTSFMCLFTYLGKYSTEEEKGSKCLLCEAGTYGPLPGAIAKADCIKCDDTGQTSSPAGSSLKSACACPAVRICTHLWSRTLKRMHASADDTHTRTRIHWQTRTRIHTQIYTQLAMNGCRYAGVNLCELWHVHNYTHTQTYSAELVFLCTAYIHIYIYMHAPNTHNHAPNKTHIKFVTHPLPLSLPLVRALSLALSCTLSPWRTSSFSPSLSLFPSLPLSFVARTVLLFQKSHSYPTMICTLSMIYNYDMQLSYAHSLP